MSNKELKIVADDEAMLLNTQAGYKRVNRFSLTISASLIANRNTALCLNAYKHFKIMNPLFKWYMDKLIETGLAPLELVSNLDSINDDILKKL